MPMVTLTSYTYDSGVKFSFFVVDYSVISMTDISRYANIINNSRL